MGRGYTSADVKNSLACLQKANIPFGVSLMLGAPGEAPETVQESLDLIYSFNIPLGTWVTIGLLLWTLRQAVVADARQSGQLAVDVDSRQFFAGANYLSPELPRAYMEYLIETLRIKKGYSVQVNQPFAGYVWDNVETASRS
jgi:radical SAM superfamily enzyme YgiQ (UPF0313 family)